MAEEVNGNGEAEVKTPIGSFRFAGKRMAEFIAVFALCLSCVFAYALWKHSQESSELLKELGGAIKEMVQAQREQNCLIAFAQDIREQKSELCKRLSR